MSSSVISDLSLKYNYDQVKLCKFSNYASLMLPRRLMHHVEKAYYNTWFTEILSRRLSYDLLTCLDVSKPVSMCWYGGWVCIFLAHLDPERRAWDMHSVEFDVDVMDSVLSRHESDWVCVWVNWLNETVILRSRWRNNLQTKCDLILFSSLILLKLHFYIIRFTENSIFIMISIYW